MATSSSAVTILQYTQQNPNDVVTASVSGSTTTLSVTNQLIFINNLANLNQSPPLPATLSIAATSTGAASTSANRIEQLFNGTITIRNIAGTANVLTTTFTNAVLGGLAGGSSVSLVGSRPPGGVLFTSDIPALQALILDNPPENFAISFSNLSSPLAITSNTIAGFTAQNTGTFATAVIPEPSGIVMAGMAMVAGLGSLGWRRRQSSRA